MKEIANRTIQIFIGEAFSIMILILNSHMIGKARLRNAWRMVRCQRLLLNHNQMKKFKFKTSSCFQHILKLMMSNQKVLSMNPLWVSSSNHQMSSLFQLVMSKCSVVSDPWIRENWIQPKMSSAWRSETTTHAQFKESIRIQAAPRRSITSSTAPSAWIQLNKKYTHSQSSLSLKVSLMATMEPFWHTVKHHQARHTPWLEEMV